MMKGTKEAYLNFISSKTILIETNRRGNSAVVKTEIRYVKWIRFRRVTENECDVHGSHDKSLIQI
jgi:hypothetical protein